MEKQAMHFANLSEINLAWPYLAISNCKGHFMWDEGAVARRLPTYCPEQGILRQF
jgi:hypothetical protein